MEKYVQYVNEMKLWLMVFAAALITHLEVMEFVLYVLLTLNQMLMELVAIAFLDIIFKIKFVD